MPNLLRVLTCPGIEVTHTAIPLSLERLSKLGFTDAILDAAVRSSDYASVFNKDIPKELDLTKLILVYHTYSNNEDQKLLGLFNAEITYDNQFTVNRFTLLTPVTEEDDLLREWFKNVMTDLFSRSGVLLAARDAIGKAYRGLGDHIAIRSGKDVALYLDKHRYICVNLGDHVLPVVHQPVFRTNSDDTGEELNIDSKEAKRTIAQWLPRNADVEKAFLVYLGEVRRELAWLLEDKIKVTVFNKHTPASRDTLFTLSTPKGLGYTIKVSQYDHLRATDFKPDAWLIGLAEAFL